MKVHNAPATKRYRWYDFGYDEHKAGHPYDPPMSPGDKAHDDYREGWDAYTLEQELYGEDR